MRRTTITLPADLVEELLAEVKAASKTEAVITAVRDEIRLRKRQRIKAMAGQMEFVKSAAELRHGDRRLG